MGLTGLFVKASGQQDLDQKVIEESGHSSKWRNIQLLFNFCKVCAVYINIWHFDQNQFCFKDPEGEESEDDSNFSYGIHAVPSANPKKEIGIYFLNQIDLVHF